MTDQQTAATDNALVEKLQKAVTRALCFATEAKCSEVTFAGRWASALRELAGETTEAAERIKSLQAELATAKGAHEMSALTVIKLSAEVAEHDRAEADRQRMRETLEAILKAPMIDHQDNSRSVYGIARAALNPATQGGE